MDTCPKRANRAKGEQSQMCTSQIREPPLYPRTDRRTLYRTRKFSEVLDGTLGPEKAREDPIPSMLGIAREGG